MFKTIDEILLEVGEDKHTNLTTTSNKFKTDLWNFFKALPNHQKFNCVEFGTHKGGTTRVLSYLFNKVYTINLPGHMDAAQKLNFDRDNIKFIEMNLYDTPTDSNFVHSPISVFVIDAGHTTDQILMDVSRAKNLKHADGDVYFVFDDVGLFDDVYLAVQQLIYVGQLEKVCSIGHDVRHNFGGSPERILRKDAEGMICKLT